MANANMELSRRRWLVGAGALMSTAALAACGANQAAPGAGPTPGAGGTPGTQLNIPGSGLVSGPFPGEAKNLTGAGATFPAALYSKWFDDYYGLTSVQVNYQSIGSGRRDQGHLRPDGGLRGHRRSDDRPAAGGGQGRARSTTSPPPWAAVVATYNLPEVPATTRLASPGRPWRPSSWARSRSGTTPRSRPTTPARPCRTRTSSPSTARTAPGRPTSSPTTSPTSAPSGRTQVGNVHHRQLARRPRRAGQRGRRRRGEAEPLLPRLRGVDLRQAEQAGLRRDEEQGGQCDRPG